MYQDRVSAYEEAKKLIYQSQQKLTPTDFCHELKSAQHHKDK
jgi:hypothetical protein